LPNQANLVELNISSTNNSDIGFVSKLPKLKVLKAANNGISSTEELTTLNQIETLDLSENTAIVKIDDIMTLDKLKSLNISKTGITSLLHSKSPEEEDKQRGIFALSYLEELNVANNQLLSLNPVLKTYLFKTKDQNGEEIEIERAHLENLRQLNLNYTGPNDIDYGKLILLKNLTHLYLRGNEIEYVSNEIVKLNNLEYINLSDNLIQDIEMFIRVESIEEDDKIGENSDGTPILKDNPNVEYFKDKEGNIFKRIDLKATRIELSHNKITDITPLTYFRHDIKYLDLSENAVYEIDTIDGGRFSFSEGLNLKKQGAGWEEPIYYMLIKDKEVSVDQYIILPSLFQNSKNSRSKIYSQGTNNFTVENIQLNNNEEYQVPGYYNVIIDYDKTEEDELKVILHCGCADGSIIHNSNDGCADGSILHFKISEDPNSIDSAVFKDEKLVSSITYEIRARGKSAKSALKIINVHSYVFEEIDRLYLEGKGITDITGLASFTNLKYLYLSNNNISSIYDLRENEDMIELYLSNNTNLKDNNSAIENMVYLTKLDLANTGLTNLNVLNKLIENMHKNDTESYPIKVLNLSGNKIGTADGIEKLKSLEELYISNIGIKDISKLSSLTNLRKLNASENRIEDLENLRVLNKLKVLNISNNNIENIEPISGIALDELDFSINRVKDVTSLAKSYTNLKMDSNLINNINKFEGLRIQNFSVTNQKLTHTVEQGETGDITIELPTLLQLSQKSGSKVYTANDFILTNCTLTADKKSVIVNVESLKNQIAIVKINGGNAHNTTFAIAEPLEGTITYEPSNEIPTTKDITASITFNRENVTITNNDGKDTYVFTENGEFTFKYMDENGFEGVTVAKVTNIDKLPPEGTVIQEIVNKEVIVKIDLNESIVPIDGWTTSEDGLSITKTYSADANETIDLTDNVGNTSSVQVVVEIDTTAPTITGVENDKIYGQDVTPIIEDKNLDIVKLIKDDIEVEGYEVGTAIIESGKYVLTAIDKFQNETTVTFEIDVSGVVISISDQIKITEDETLGEETKPVIRVTVPKTTIAQLREMLTSEMSFEILNAQGEWVYDEDYIGTGCQILMESGKTYTIIVYGDTNGDGKISIGEVSNAAMVAIGKAEQKDEIKLKAIDTSGNGTINVADVATIAMLCLNNL